MEILLFDMWDRQNNQCGQREGTCQVGIETKIYSGKVINNTISKRGDLEFKVLPSLQMVQEIFHGDESEIFKPLYRI